MKKTREILASLLKILLGTLLFSLGFDMFLEPNGINAGGLSGLAQILVEVLGVGSVGVLTALMNLPLFLFGGVKVGKKFFFGSLVGMLSLTLWLELMALLPAPAVEPLLCAIYGGVIGGVGLGIVFSTGASTGGSDIIVRLLKLRYRNVPIGTINIVFDLSVVVLTGVAFGDVSKALYSAVAVFVCGQVVDAVVYRFDYSKVALIITKEYDLVAQEVGIRLDRGCTFLHGEGSYTKNQTKVVLTAVKRQQVAELKELVANIDPNAFVILQEAHQVLGDGFARYSRDAL